MVIIPYLVWFWMVFIWLPKQFFSKVNFHAMNIFNSSFVTRYLFFDPTISIALTMFSKGDSFLPQLNTFVDVVFIICTTIKQRLLCMQVITYIIIHLSHLLYMHIHQSIFSLLLIFLVLLLL